jgi:nucleoid DNA-binding protein
LELYSSIKELLASNDFVSLPGIGSFVQSYQPAKLAADGKSFLPPRQTITFDTQRTFNDGLLERYIQDVQAISSTDAAAIAKKFVVEISDRLSSGAVVNFENVGSLSKSSSGSIVFKQADDEFRASDTYGLEAVAVKPLDTPLPSSKPADSDVGKQPVRSTHSHHTASQFSTVGIPIMLAAAAMAILMLVGGLLIFIPELRFWNSPTIAVHSDYNPDYIIDDKIEKDSTLPTATDTGSSSENLPETQEPEIVGEKVAVETDKKQALYYEEPDDKTYYIIAGSFEQIENAQILFNTLAKQGYSPEILQSDGRFRVSISKFSERNRALRELANLRNQKSTQSVWLLGL